PRVRPHGVEEPRDRHVRLEQEGRADHQIALRLQRKHAAEPGRDGLPVVVLVHEPADEGAEHPEQDRDEEERVHDPVARERGRSDAVDLQAPVDEHHGTEAQEQAGRAAEDHRHPVVEVLGDPDRARPRLRDEDPDHVTADDAEHPEMEREAADEEQTPLEELRRARRPGVAVAAVAPYVPDDEARQRDVRQQHPEERVEAAHPPTSASSGAPKGSSPTSSAGGPSSARRRASSSWRAVGWGSASQSASSTAAWRLPRSWSAARTISSGARSDASSSLPSSGRSDANSSTTGK